MDDRSKGRILISILFGAVALVSGCRDPNSPAGEQNGATATVPAVVAPEAVAEGPKPAPATALPAIAAVPVSAQELSAAQWTRHACSLDEVNGSSTTVHVQKTSPVVFGGYVLDDAGGVPAGFSLVLKHTEGSFKVPAKTGISRPDVAVFFKEPALNNAGFQVSADLAGLTAGTYEVVFLVGAGDASYFCESGKRIDIL